MEDLESIVRQAFLDAFPNADRVGCPGRNALRSLLDKREQGDPEIWSHVCRCSPCSREILDLRRAEGQKWKRRALWTVAACLLLGAGLLMFTRGRENERTPRFVARNAGPVSDWARFPNPTAQLDFQHLSSSRGTESTPEPVPTMPRSAVTLAILLPPGSEPGIYQFDIRTAANIDKPIFGPVRGEAITTPGGKTTLTVRVNLTTLRPGPYVAAWRHPSDSLTHVATLRVSQ